MECIHCKAEIENDDNFCHNCGHWTTHGYLFFKQNPKNVEMFNGEVIKQNNKVGTLMTLLVLGFIIFTVMMLIRGGDMFRPYYYLKKQIYNWKYGYNTSLISATNQYEKEIITTIEDANDFIERDIGKQDMECSENLDILVIENELKRNYDIPSVSLCDVDTKQAENIQKVVDKIFTLFPSAKGYLTNITIANATTSDNYIAYFQPIYQFVNGSQDINSYNKVNKTQILLNSYYFLNTDILNNSINKIVKENWYVKDANWESIVAHEFGHYITFVALLKDQNVDNVTLITSDNIVDFNKVLELSNNQYMSKQIIQIALNNYNSKYRTNLSEKEFALTISNYAGETNKNGELVIDEVVAEAVHDYYLHGNNSYNSSLEIIEVLKSKLS
jgi:hypothetical protein